jgi:hypothetical protein
MARASELIKKMSEFTSIAEVTIARYARFAREAGLLSQAGRGNSGAQMKAEDAVNLLACILIGGTAQEADTLIKKFQEITVYGRSADHIDDRHLNKEQKKRLKKFFPILFDREHTLYDLLLDLLRLAIQNPEDFEIRFDESNLSYACDGFSAEIEFNIDLNDEASRAAFQLLPEDIQGSRIRRVNVSFSYGHPEESPLPEGFQRSCYLSFSILSDIAKAVSPQLLH